MTIFLTVIGINIAILVGFLLGSLVAVPSKSDQPKNVGTLFIYEDPADDIDHIYADFNVDISDMREMKECKFTIDTSVHFPKIR